MEENKKGWICCSIDNAYHGNKKTRLVVVDNYEKVKEFIKENIKSIKDTVETYIKNGELIIDKEIIKENSYYLLLKNNKKGVFSLDGCEFQLDAFEFTYNIPFNFG